MEAGIRGVEVGALLADRDPTTRKNRYPALELLRLAIPRRTYTNNHMDVVAVALKNVYDRRYKITKGYSITYEEPIMRHFTVELERSEWKQRRGYFLRIIHDHGQDGKQSQAADEQGIALHLYKNEYKEVKESKQCAYQKTVLTAFQDASHVEHDQKGGHDSRRKVREIKPKQFGHGKQQGIKQH